MRLTEVMVSNYRSIESKTTFELHNLTTLIGPNNEGKSNLLRALALGMRIIRTWSELNEGLAKRGEISGPQLRLVYNSFSPRRRPNPTSDIDYEWSNDFPLSKQAVKGARPTEIRLKFKLEEGEIEDFKEFTGLSSNGDLPVQLLLSRTATSIALLKPGKGSASYKANAHLITRFISDRVSHVLIPAVRTMDQAMTLLNELANSRLNALAKSDEYQQALQTVNALRSSAVEAVQDDLQTSIASYLPGVKSVELLTRDVRQQGSVSSITIDDGTATPLEQKGDGIKSLFALALIQHLARDRMAARRDSFILLVDEPEAHLHSRAVHDLQTLFTKLSRNQQVVLATHNPVFVNREVVRANVLVQRNSASPAKQVRKIRETLGVELQDNLDSAEIVVLTEGWTDAHVLPAVFGQTERSVKSDIETGRVVFKATTGTGKMKQHIIKERSTACRLIAVLDNDAAGRAEAKSLSEDGILDQANIYILREEGRQNSEIEDLLDPTAYLSALVEKFGRPFTASHFADRRKKWSDNFGRAADALAVVGDAGENLKKAKVLVAEACLAEQGRLIKETASPGFAALKDAIWPQPNP